MIKYFAKKAITAGVTIYVVMTVSFFLISFAPFDPAIIVLGPHTPPETIEAFRREFHLNEPLHIQYFLFIEQLLHGDLGISYASKAPVILDIYDRFPNTFLLAIAGGITALSFGGWMGIVSAVKQDSKFDFVARSMSLLGISMPIFLLGPILILIFSVYLNLLPTSGTGGIEHVILPALTLGLFSSANVARITRASMLDVLRKDYIRTARSKGLAERVVIYKHALKNSLLPLSTVFGLQMAMMFGGAILTEVIFAWPGIGRLIIDSVLARDYPMVRACLIIIAGALVLMNLIIDISYRYMDPRIKLK